MRTLSRRQIRQKAQATELAKRAAGLNSELEKANAQRNELQTKLDQATSEIKSAKSQLEEKQSRLGGMQSELENVEQAVDQAKAEATELAKRAAGLKRDELQTKLDQATSEIKSAQSRPELEKANAQRYIVDPRIGGI